MLPKNMNNSQLLLSPQGRIPRSTFWLRFYLPVLALQIVAMILDFSLGLFNAEIGLGVFSGILSLLIIYPSILVCIKRFHDRNRSGWFYLLLLVPILNIWPAIELYFLKGSQGLNNYGPDPLEE